MHLEYFIAGHGWIIFPGFLQYVQSAMLGVVDRSVPVDLAGIAKVRENVDDDFPGAATPNSYNLKGHGLSLAWLAHSRLNLTATWAHRNGSNPNPTTTGKDQDGSLDKNRWWFSASVAF
jgi:hypothetical protein